MPALRHRLRLAFAAALVAQWAPAPGIEFVFDYTYDSLGFFAGANTNRRDTLEAAGSFFETYLADDLLTLDATNSGNPANTWAARFTDPSDGVTLRSLTNLVVTSDTLTVFVGARDLPGGALGQGGPGGFFASGTASWLETVRARGETGALGPVTNDCGPWGGALSFDTGVNWYFDSDVATIETFPGTNDFYSVALHELAHLLGFGTAQSFNRLLSGLSFTGSSSVAEYGGEVPMYNTSHWLTNAVSSLYGGVGTQEVAMDPDLLVGTRKYFTELDVAGLADAGWEFLIPEPPCLAMAAALLAILALRRRGRPRHPAAT
ncbi:MAG: peptidase M10A and M12B matrixin and adamalysin [Verrucomicrobiae bacterium]|nr:peptidase M10A and M12B matrixin and adamalysin [Verrucomicrobiae bacterium]